ncbi:kin of IRRE-like protein 1, partial [Saccoglossus kowalevskii]
LEKQSFILEPVDVTVVSGNQIRLQCQIHHKEGIAIWSKDSIDLSNDLAITNGANSRMTITGDQSTGEYYLTIDNAQSIDVGVYKIRVTAADNSEQITSQSATITIV